MKVTKKTRALHKTSPEEKPEAIKMKRKIRQLEFALKCYRKSFNTSPLQQTIQPQPGADELSQKEYQTAKASRDLLGASKVIDAQKRLSTPVFAELAKKVAEEIKGVSDLSERRLAEFAKQNGLKMPEADLGTSE